MTNINSYIVSHGAKRIGFFNPYNELDALVFARISYLPFYKIKLGKNETIGSACAKMIEQLSPKDYGWPDDVKLVENLKNARRFKNKRISDYRRNNNKALEKQFSAITIHLSHTKMYLSFFGTDDTIIGWKEDFNLAFLDHVPAQTEAKKYLDTLEKKYPLKRIYLGGHSKGGNLAIYASVLAPDAVQKRIKKIHNYDGPGLRKGTIALDAGSEKVTGKIESFIPQESVVGRLFEHNEKVEVVKSEAKGLFQHDVYSWQIHGTKFVRSKSTQSSNLTDKTITRWLETATPSERKIFINALFDALASADINNPLELKAKWLKMMPTMLKSFVKLPKDQRKVVMVVWKKLGKSFLEARREENAK